MIGDHPWLGTGLGTFAWIYPSYRSNALTSWGVWDRAHSTPLEIASDMGLPLAGIVVTGWAAIFAVLGFGLWSRQRDHIIVIAALAVASLGILHSLIDFSLQIPGFALMVFSLVGAGLAQSFRAVRPLVIKSSEHSFTSPRLRGEVDHEVIGLGDSPRVERRGESPSPQPSPRDRRGERERTAAADAVATLPLI
jgi:hypothetical protein